MTTYRLPDRLGGLPVHVAGKRGDGQLICIPDIESTGLNRLEVHISPRDLVEGAVEPITLPWSLNSHEIPETFATVSTHDGAVVVSAFDFLRVEAEHYHPDDAEQLATAILHAVRVVRAAAEQEASKP